ncbi:MAG: hypothetical protein Q9228_008066 [Teloschistes exilis]
MKPVSSALATHSSSSSQKSSRVTQPYQGYSSASPNNLPPQHQQSLQQQHYPVQNPAPLPPLRREDALDAGQQANGTTAANGAPIHAGWYDYGEEDKENDSERARYILPNFLYFSFVHDGRYYQQSPTVFCPRIDNIIKTRQRISLREIGELPQKPTAANATKNEDNQNGSTAMEKHPRVLALSTQPSLSGSYERSSLLSRIPNVSSSQIQEKNNLTNKVNEMRTNDNIRTSCQPGTSGYANR